MRDILEGEMITLRGRENGEVTGRSREGGGKTHIEFQADGPFRELSGGNTGLVVWDWL